MKHTLDLIFSLLAIIAGANCYFFPKREVPSGDSKKIAKIKWIGFALAMIGLVLLAMAF